MDEATEISGGVTDLAFIFKIMAVDPVFDVGVVSAADADDGEDDDGEDDDGEDFSVSDNDCEVDCSVASFTSFEDDVVAVDARATLLLLLRCRFFFPCKIMAEFRMRFLLVGDATHR